MPDLTLFHCPPACSRITMVALEETGRPYADILVKLMDGQQRTPEYLAVNPKGKVPALRVGDTVLTENPVILNYLDGLAPHAKLLPSSDDPVTRAKILADVVWASSTLHTATLRQVVAPLRLTDGDPSGVKTKGLTMMAEQAEAISSKLDNGGWWFGKEWSIMDVYISWIFTTAQVGGFELARYPTLVEHHERVRARPAFQRMLAREKQALERAGVKMPAMSAPRAAGVGSVISRS